MLGIPAAALLQAAVGRAATEPLRCVLSLDGTWQLAEGGTDQRPARFDRQVSVPGLVDLAQPAFAPVTFNNQKRRFGPEDAALAQRSYWYRREFTIAGAGLAVATLLVRQAAFGSTVYLNGAKVARAWRASRRIMTTCAPPCAAEARSTNS